MGSETIEPNNDTLKARDRNQHITGTNFIGLRYLQETIK